MIYFLRHGESESNALELFAGQKENSPLSPKGEQQARDAAESIRSQDLKFDRFVVSPQLRTKQTAEIIIDSLGLDKAIISYDERAVEYDMGDYTGTPKRKITFAEPGNPHGLEDPIAFRQRVMSLIGEFQKLPGNTLLVSHGWVSQVIQSVQQDLSPGDINTLASWPNATLIKVEL